jgi:hemerythrin-like domain-containing protein
MNEPPEPIAGLIRDHRAIEAVVTETSASVQAAAPSGDTALVEAAFASLLRLRDLLALQVAVHIEKEERVLFPVLRSQIADLAEFVDDMIAEHDQVRQKKETIRERLDALDAQHEAVNRIRAGVIDGLDGAEDADRAAVVAALRDTVVQLDWVLQGHFTGEEDGLFLPAEELLSAEVLVEMAGRMAEFEAT